MITVCMCVCMYVCVYIFVRYPLLFYNPIIRPMVYVLMYIILLCVCVNVESILILCLRSQFHWILFPLLPLPTFLPTICALILLFYIIMAVIIEHIAIARGRAWSFVVLC